MSGLMKFVTDTFKYPSVLTDDECASSSDGSTATATDTERVCVVSFLINCCGWGSYYPTFYEYLEQIATAVFGRLYSRLGYTNKYGACINSDVSFIIVDSDSTVL